MPGQPRAAGDPPGHRPGSPADAAAGSGRDIDHDNRGIDARDHADLFGTYDLGADEWNDPVFADGFEG